MLPNAIIKSFTESATYDLDRVHFGSRSLESRNYPNGSTFQEAGLEGKPKSVLNFFDGFSSRIRSSSSYKHSMSHELGGEGKKMCLRNGANTSQWIPVVPASPLHTSRLAFRNLTKVKETVIF